MYRLIPSQQHPAYNPEPWGTIAALGIVIGLSLAGFIGAAAVAYHLPATASKSYWFISRSSGVIAYVLLTAGILWGLMQSGALFRGHLSPLVTFGMHSFLSWMALGLSVLHGVILLKDTYIHFDLARIATPFLADYRPIPVGLGIIGFYLMLLLTLSFYARTHLGQRTFRTLHYVSFAVFIMVTLHGVLAGTDNHPLAWLYGASLVAVVVLTILRIANTRGRGKAAPALHQPQAVAVRPVQTR